MVVSFGGGGLAGVLLAEEAFKGIQAVGPEAFVEVQPLVRARERSRIQAAQMGAATNLAPDQSGAFQYLDVLGGSGERNREGFRELPDRPLSARELAEHVAAGRIAECMKNCIQGMRI
ncbi:hypothetical protein N826_11755 [Skermanella aerolata KACC 11604]|nr:hypothetical protein N826_11755 [Skermanella aerolata KACC 11604]